MKIATLLVFISIIASGTIAQSGAASTQSQSDAITSVQTRADSWQHLVLQEKCFVHTDKYFYLAGEICWCRIYCVDGNTHRPLAISKIGYVEILDADNKPVLQGKIALDQGYGEGSFYIPPSVASGNYRLRAYTNWMKNFGPETFFEEPLTIVNTIKGIDTAAIEKQPATSYSLRFFPEGGDLVAALPSTIAFEALDDQGKPLDAGGAVLTENNDTLIRFHTTNDGIGLFAFTPVRGHNYRAILGCPDDSTRTWLLPPILTDGYTIHLRDEGSQNISIAVHASAGLDIANTRLFIHSRNTSVFTGQPPVVAGDSALFTVDKSRLQEGNTRFTLFDAAGRPRAERQIFIPPHSKLEITATTDNDSYATRQKITLHIGLPDTVGARLSVAVYRLDSLQGPPPTDILRWLWLSSEWSGRPASPACFDDPIIADLGSLTHGWTRFRWTDVLSHPSGPRLYPPELRGQLITGRLTDPHTGAPAKETTAWLSTPGLTFQFATAQTDSGGKFQFDIKDFYGGDGIVIHTEHPYKVDAFTPYLEQYTRSGLPPLRLTIPLTHGLSRHNIGMQVQNIYMGDSLRHFALPRVDTTPFFGRADYTYLLDNYTRFSTIEEVLREYVREINITRARGQFHLVMLNEPAHSVYRDNQTLVLLDGVPVPNDRIFAYDALKVKKLDVIPREYILGPSHFSGIASFTTYKGDFEGLELDSSSLQLEYEGLQYRRQFYTPLYTTIRQTQSRLPDFRNVLYWSPDVRANTKSTPVEFFSSDIPGEYLVVVQGLSPDGRAGVACRRFTVATHHPMP